MTTEHNEQQSVIKQNLTTQPAAAPGIDLMPVRELLARRLWQWRTHIPTNPDAPGTRAIITYDPKCRGQGETDYNNDVAIWREACSVLDEALALLDASPKGDDVAVAATGDAAERAWFEAWAVSIGARIDADEHGNYLSSELGYSKLGWDAHAALSATTDSPKVGSEALLREVCELLGDAGCGACAGSMAPMEDLHGRIVAHLASANAQASDAEVRPNEPPKNWCPTCDKRPNDPTAVLCPDAFHQQANSHGAGVDHG